MTIYPETGTNAQFNMAKAALLRSSLNPFSVLFPATQNNGSTKAAFLNAKVLLSELQQDLCALRVKAGRALLARSVGQPEVLHEEPDTTLQKQSKVLGMINHLKHTKNSIAPERLN